MYLDIFWRTESKITFGWSNCKFWNTSETLENKTLFYYYFLGKKNIL